MPGKIDPLNKKYYRAVNAALTVRNMKAAIGFYQKAFGFKSRGVMKSPDGKPMHAELVLRDTILMLGPEMPGFNKSVKTLGGCPFAMYMYVENADKVYAKALKLGAKRQTPVMDMFWGDRCGRVTDPEGYVWSISSHIAEPTPREMARKMKEQMSQMKPPQKK